MFMLLTPLVRTQKVVGSMVEKACSLSKYLNDYEKTVGRNTGVKGTASQDSDGKRNMLSKTGSKEIGAESLAESCPEIMLKKNL